MLEKKRYNEEKRSSFLNRVQDRLWPAVGLTLFALFCSFTTASPFFGLPMPSGNSDFGLSLLRSAEAGRLREKAKRTDELAKLQIYKEDLGARVQKALDANNERLKILVAERDRLSSGNESVAQIMSEREKVTKALPGVVNELRKMVEKEEVQLKQFVGLLERDITEKNEANKSESGKSDAKYSWEKYKTARQELKQAGEKHFGLKEQEKMAIRDRERVREKVSGIQSRYASQRESLSQKMAASKIEEVTDQYTMQLSLLEKLQSESAQLGGFQEELAQRKAFFSETEAAVQGYETKKRKALLPHIEAHIAFVSTDLVWVEKEISSQKGHDTALSREVETSLAAIKNERESLEQERLRFEAVGDRSVVQQAQLEKVEEHIALLDLQRDAYETRLELAHERTAYRELGRDIIKTMLHRKKPDEKKIQEWLQAELVSFRSKVSSTDLMLSKLADEQKSQRYRLGENETKVTSFEKRMSDRTLGKAHYVYADIILLLKQQARLRQNLLTMSSERLSVQETMRDDLTFVLARLERDQRSLNIWQRSDLALTTENLHDAWTGAKRVFSFLWDRTLMVMNPLNVLRSIREVSLYEFALFLLFLLGLLFFMVFFRFGLLFVGQRIDRLLYIYQGQTFAIYLTFGRSLVRFFETHCRGLSVWLYLRLSVVVLEPQLWSSEWWAYTISIFFLLTIPFFLYISRSFMVEFKKINQRMSFLFFTERLEDKFLFLMSSTLYTSAVLLPLRRVFLTYPYSNEVQLSNVLRGGWTLILTLIVLFFFSKDDIFRFLPSQSAFAQWFRAKVDQYYYPVFIFAIGLSILVNPYVGYTNFAVYLAICIPLTAVIAYALFMVQGYVRRYSVYMFMKEENEEEEEVSDRFEHAKLYYGFFVVFTFIGSCLAGFMAITRIWGFEYTVAQLWKGLSHDWVVSFEGTGVHIGLGGALTLSVFLVSGLIISSLFNKFVLTRLFDIFRTEYGAQNTVSRVLHYLIVVLSLVLGLHAIKLGQLGNWVLLALAAGIAFGSRDLVADFFAGIWILFERPIELGNFIQTGELKGTVKSIAMRATTIRTAKNFSVVIPNRELVAKPIINWGAGYYAVGFEFTVLVGYGANADEARDLIAQVVSDNKLVLRIPAVTVRLDEFEDSGYRFFVRAFISSRRVRDQWDVASQIRLVLTKEFDARGIKIPYPHRKIIHSMKSFEVTKRQLEEMSE